MNVPEKRRGRGKIRAGDDSALAPFTPWHALWRSTFHTRLADDATSAERLYTVDIDYFDWDAHLYVDGKQAAVATLPAKFPVPGGAIDVELTTFGVKRMHFVPDDGSAESQLHPDPRSAEAMRARFSRRHPVASRVIAWTAVATLLASLALLAPQLIEQISQMGWIAERFGTFTSPIALSAEINTALTVAGVAASIERALTLRYHWLIDADPWWLED
ncbi:hypothetical protein [Tessaracoccus massiliensis]|uniref:hypothetical protein n=1 Tax=Tessaracoccus massiliensis TaxID=1522311 RepID=UPI00058B7DFB|nr:hypothetical protein [Tessaracoccus massiliensis]